MMANSKLLFSLLGCSSIRGPSLHCARQLCSHSAAHPWPEWVTFVDRLKTKGFFSNTDSVDSVSCTDSLLLHRAAIAFARHRFDLFRSLSLLDLQTVVEKGCPDHLLRVTNAAKRIRAHLQLDERKVCNACKIRGPCDRYCELMPDNESSPRTSDVVRVLFAYALHPSVLSETKISSDRAIIEKSARRLLSELVELSDTVPGPEIAPPSVPAPRVKKERPKFDENDWKCSRCNFMNFARNTQCKKCDFDAPKKIDNSVEMKKGDWICPGCGFMHFASKTSCIRCSELRPPRPLERGSWECPSCNHLNSRRNISCKMCNLYRPRTGRTES